MTAHLLHRDSAERVGDLERDVTCNELARHYSAGRLTEDEMQQRTTTAIMATTRGELYALLVDLPRLSTPPTSSGMPERRPAPRGILDALIGFFSISAVLCFVLLMIVLLGAQPGAAVALFLGGLAGSVAMFGLIHFSRGFQIIRRDDGACSHR